MIKIGILGTGFGARTIMPAFQLDNRAKVVALYGRNQDHLKKCLPNNVKGYTDWRELISSPEVDAVAIALPPPIQAQVLSEIVKHKIHVFIEKPIGVGSSAALEIAKRLDENRKIHTVDFEFPFLPAWQDFFKLQKNIGAIQLLKLSWHVKTTAFRGPAGWKIDPALGGGILSNLACHSLNYCELVLGKAQSIYASLNNDETLVEIVMDFPENKKAQLSVSMNTEFGNGHRLESFGLLGGLTLENVSSDYMNNFTLRIKTSEGEQTKSYPVDTRFPDGRVMAVHQLVRLFLDSIEDGVSSSPNLYDGHRNEILIEACRISNSTGRKVELQF